MPSLSLKSAIRGGGTLKDAELKNDPEFKTR